MHMPINSLGYSCEKKLQRDNLWHTYNEPINIYSVIIDLGHSKLYMYLNFCNRRLVDELFVWRFLFSSKY